MKNVILMGWQLFLLTIMIAVVVGIQTLTAFVINDSTKVADNVSCNVKDVVIENERVRLKIDCNGKEITMSNVMVIVSYMKNPGPLTCALYKTDSIVCAPRSPVENESAE